MRYFCLFFLIVSGWVWGDEFETNFLTLEQIASLNSPSNMLIGDIVSPFSGNVALKFRDLVAKGAQEISLDRIYYPFYLPDSFTNSDQMYLYKVCDHLERHYKGWVFFPHERVELSNRFPYKLRVIDSSGVTVDFSTDKKENSNLLPLPFSTNFSGDSISGKVDFRNMRLFWDEAGFPIVIASDGTKRIYSKKNGNFFFLEKEILPNGKVIKYYRNNEINRIEALDPKERFVYASIDLVAPSQYKSSSSTKASYYLEKRVTPIKFKEKNKQSEISFDGNKYSPPLLLGVESQHDLKETIRYSKYFLLDSMKRSNLSFELFYSCFGEKESRHHRVKQISLPVGVEGKFVPIYRINYALGKEIKTEVKHQDGSRVVYTFDNYSLIKQIQYFSEAGICRKEKQFYYENGYLKKIETNADNYLIVKTFENDEFGNPTKETLSWPDGCYTLFRSFSKDGLHCLLREEKENGSKTHFTYLPGTNLVNSKIIEGQKREFFEYDDRNNLLVEIVDDGISNDKRDLTGVKQRLITRYLLRAENPFLHMPESIIQSYLEAGNEKLLKKRDLHYDSFGNVCKEDVYDANDQFVYSLHKVYNDRGQLHSETNALGYTSTYTYDDNNNLKTATSASNRRTTTQDYDSLGRLTLKRQIGTDGILHETSYKYDALGYLIQTIDPLHNETFYEYDPLCHKVTKTEADEAITETVYDGFGNAIKKIDANGNATLYSYNVYGSPIEIVYPDGAKEQFTYYNNGKVKSHIDLNALITNYTYDYFDRVLTQSNSFYTCTSTYDAFHLISETDPEGNLTTYTYDGAGRKISENQCGKVTTYSYDSLGRIASTTLGELTTYYSYDLLDQLTKVKKADLYSICYEYDPDGNRVKIVKYNGEEAFDFDSLGRKISYTDAFNYKTFTKFDESFGSLVVKKTSPDSVKTEETFDRFGKLIRIYIQKEEVILSDCEKKYDPCGNLCLQKDHIYENGQFIKTQELKFAYNNRNFLECLTRAHGTEVERATTFSYTHSGLIETKRLPSGKLITTTYNLLGQKEKVESLDIHHSFKYDFNGYLLEAKDENGTIIRSTDPFGNILTETFPNGITVKKRYDAWNRPVWIKFGELGSIEYDYDPLYLRSVTRVSSTGLKLYTHIYDDYDSNGNLSEETLPFDLGKISYTLDRKDRISATSNPYFNETYKYDVNDNLIQKVVNGLSVQYEYDDRSHLTFESDSHMAYFYDSMHNRRGKNDQTITYNDLNELAFNEHDLDGNLLQKGSTRFYYDSLNRLLGTDVVRFTYDSLGRRLTKIVNDTLKEAYLYDGCHDIGTLDSNGNLKQLRVLGIYPKTIALELENETYIPLIDLQNNIKHLIDPLQKSISHTFDFTAFGERLDQESSPPLFNPWCYASKRVDPDLNLIDFGYRFYDPESGRWMTTDPIGFMDLVNLYAYARNNPLKYTDPDGRFAIVLVPIFSFCIGSGAIIAPTIAVLSGALIGMAAYQIGGKALRSFDRWMDKSFNSVQTEVDVPQEQDDEKTTKKNDPWVFPENPDDLLPELPRDPKGRIQTSDNVRITPGRHDFEEGDSYNPRHHDQHYHVEHKRNPANAWNDKNKEIIKPPNYTQNSGTGFLPGEIFPGL